VPLSARNPITNTYPVEASGWGSDQSFFVEKCELEWNEETGKYVVLTRSLSPGAMVFLRLLLPSSPDRSLPVPYHAQPVGFTREGRRQFRLEQVQPTGGLREKAK
jgi:hypothetical protein